SRWDHSRSPMPGPSNSASLMVSFAISGRRSRAAISRATVVFPAAGGPWTTTTSGNATRRVLGLAQESPQDGLEDAAVAEVRALARRVEADARAELLFVRAHGDLVGIAALEPCDREHLAAGQPERLAVLARHELERRDPHHQEVRAVDPLVRVRDRGAHAQQVRAFRGPVA